MRPSRTALVTRNNSADTGPTCDAQQVRAYNRQQRREHSAKKPKTMAVVQADLEMLQGVVNDRSASLNWWQGCCQLDNRTVKNLDDGQQFRCCMAKRTSHLNCMFAVCARGAALNN